MPSTRSRDVCAPTCVCRPAILSEARAQRALLACLIGRAQAALARDHAAREDLDRALELLEPQQPPTISRRSRRKGLADWQVQRVSAYIDARLEASLRTAELAGILGLSPGYFSHAFKQATGMPPSAFISSRRLDAARARLLETDERLATIAHMHGYCDQAHFTRAFTRATGMAPSVWRRMHASEWGGDSRAGSCVA